MATARDILESSLRLAGVLADSESASAAMISKGLGVLNDLAESWSLDGLMLFENEKLSFQLPGPQSFYTLGPTGDFDSDRPIYISNATLEVQGDLPFEVPLKLIENDDEWSAISTKSLTSTLPTKIYVENSFPLSKVYLWPIPIDLNKINLYTAKQIARFTNASAQIFLPPGYSRALKYNLALELAESYGKSVDPRVDSIANDSKADIQRANWKPSFMCSDVAGLINRKSFNILTGE